MISNTSGVSSTRPSTERSENSSPGFGFSIISSQKKAVGSPSIGATFSELYLRIHSGETRLAPTTGRPYFS